MGFEEVSCDTGATVWDPNALEGTLLILEKPQWLSQAGDRLAVGGGDTEQCVMWWDLNNPAEEGHTIPFSLPGEIEGIAIEKDRDDVYCASVTHLGVVDLDTGQLKAEPLTIAGTRFSGHIAVLGEGKVAVGAYNAEHAYVRGEQINKEGYEDEHFEYVMIVDAFGNEDATILWEPNLPGLSLFVSPDQRWLVGIAGTLTMRMFQQNLYEWVDDTRTLSDIRFWRIDEDLNLTECRQSTLPGYVLAISPDMRRAACINFPINNDGTLRICDTETGVEIIRLEHPTGGITGAAFDPLGRFLVTSTSDGSLFRWGPSGNSRTPKEFNKYMRLFDIGAETTVSAEPTGGPGPE